ncbi:MAG: radical SAM protein [Ignavibacteria bacterium]|nr:radical SAM protein [Ignavibacteria bacterium]
MKKKHYTIPIFVPELACPFQCIFCNQQKITGKQEAPAPEAIHEIISSHLATFRHADAVKHIGFFGGNFTGIPVDVQESYLKIAARYVESGAVQGIRLSTRPDYISPAVIQLLQRYHVTTVELGAQSLDNGVLRQTGRGHTAEDVARASELILSAGIELGLQMMLGLPGDSFEKSAATAQGIINLGASNTRIYPALVIRGTSLAALYEKGSYSPLSIDDAVNWSKNIYLLFEKFGVTVIKLGLHPSEGFITGNELIAGPYHVSFRELVLTAIWQELLVKQVQAQPNSAISIRVAPEEFNYAVGYKAANKIALASRGKSISFISDPLVQGRSFHVMYC